VFTSPDGVSMKVAGHNANANPSSNPNRNSFIPFCLHHYD